MRKVKRKYSEKDMEVALSLVRDDGYPVADVAKHIGIPRQTSYENLKKSVTDHACISSTSRRRKTYAHFFLKYRK